MNLDEMRRLDATKTYKELEESKKTIDDFKLRVKHDFETILKFKAENEHLTNKIQQLYEGADEQKQRINHLEAEIERTKQERNAIAKTTREPLLLKLDEANARIKRLEEAGDYIVEENDIHIGKEVWRKAKEAKP